MDVVCLSSPQQYNENDATFMTGAGYQDTASWGGYVAGANRNMGGYMTTQQGGYTQQQGGYTQQQGGYTQQQGGYMQ